MVDYRKWTTLLNLLDGDDIPQDAARDVISSATSSSSHPTIACNEHWVHCVYVIQWHASTSQYLFACLSTLGGANFLIALDRQGEESRICMRKAFSIAKRQEILGDMLGSSSLSIRARVYQAINLALLGKMKMSKKMFEDCKSRAAREASWSPGLLSFCEASEAWLHANIKPRKIELDEAAEP